MCQLTTYIINCLFLFRPVDFTLTFDPNNPHPHTIIITRPLRNTTNSQPSKHQNMLKKGRLKYCPDQSSCELNFNDRIVIWGGEMVPAHGVAGSTNNI